MFKNFFSKMFGLNELRESNMKMLDEIQQLKNHISDLERKTEKEIEIDYDNIEIDYDELNSNLDLSGIEIDYDDLASCLCVSDLARSIDYDDLADKIDASEIAARNFNYDDLARSIDYDDLADKIDASEIAQCLDFTDGHLVETVAKKILEKLLEHYNDKVK